MHGVARVATLEMAARRPCRVALVHMPLFESRRPSAQLGMVQTVLTHRGVVARAHYLNLAFARRIGWALNDALCRDSDALPLATWMLAREFDADSVDPVTGFDATTVRRLRCEAQAFIAECIACVPWHEYDFVAFSVRPSQLRFARVLAGELERACPHLEVSLDPGRTLASVLAIRRAGRPHAVRSINPGPSFDDFFADVARLGVPELVDEEALVVPLGAVALGGVAALADEAARLAARYAVAGLSVDDKVLPPSSIAAFHEALAGRVYVLDYVGNAVLSREELRLLRACGCRRLVRGTIARDDRWLDQLAVLKWARGLGIAVRYRFADDCAVP